MKDLYKRLGIAPSSSESVIREAISSPGPTADAADLAAAEFVLLDKKRRGAYDRTYWVLNTIGELRSHLGLNFKTFWARGKLRDFTYEFAAAESRGPRRTIRSLRPADISRAFGLRGTDRASDYNHANRRLLVTACAFLAMTLAAVAMLVYYAIAK